MNVQVRNSTHTKPLRAWTFLHHVRSSAESIQQLKVWGLTGNVTQELGLAWLTSRDGIALKGDWLPTWSRECTEGWPLGNNTCQKTRTWMWTSRYVSCTHQAKADSTLRKYLFPCARDWCTHFPVIYRLLACNSSFSHREELKKSGDGQECQEHESCDRQSERK